MRFLKTILSLIIIAILVVSSVSVSATTETNSGVSISSNVPYTTYMYNYNGDTITTPHAYIPSAVYSGEQLGVGDFTTPSDLEVDSSGNIYVIDSDYVPAGSTAGDIGVTGTEDTTDADTVSDDTTSSSSTSSDDTASTASTSTADTTASNSTNAADTSSVASASESASSSVSSDSSTVSSTVEEEKVDESALPDYLRSDITAKTGKQIDELVVMLPDINSITIDYGKRILAISEAYYNLDQEEKEKVQNADTLEAAVEYISITGDVVAKTGEQLDKYIALLPDVENITVYYEKRISQILSAYDNLSSTEKSAVTKKDTIDSAKQKIYYSAEIDARTADVLDKFIALLPAADKITEVYEARIQALIISYRGLTTDEKLLVKSKSVLEAAEYKLDEIQCASRYAARKGRIVVLNKDLSVKITLDSFDNNGHIDGFNSPQGVTIAKDGTIYLADTYNKRIIQFSAEGKFIRDIKDPQITMLGDDYVYRPTKVSVDTSGNIFVVALNANMGIILLDSSGDFSGFVGAQKVKYSPIDYIWKNILTEAQQNRMESFVPTEYNNIVMDSSGFIYVTTSAINSSSLAAAIMSRSMATATAPVKRLNPTGNDVLKRWGYFAPCGDINFYYDSVGNPTTSVIEDVAICSNGRYTILDTRNNRLFTYSENGELLYAFGSEGFEAGNTMMPSAITYDGKDLLVLDARTGYITRYEMTEYGKLIDEAYEHYNNYEYDQSVEVWKKVLNANASFDIAYDGIANSFLRSGQYKEAMEYFRFSNNRESYSDAYKEYRTQSIENYLLLIALIAVVVIFLIIKMFKYAGKRNRLPKYADKRETLFSRLCYALYVIIHPFDGFWDLKHEKRGSMTAANVILASLILVRIAEKFFTNYLFNYNYGYKVSVLLEVLMVLFPFVLWVISNWSVTTLVDGEGKMKDVYIFTAYALTPLVIMSIVSMVLSHLLVLDEVMYISLVGSISVFWTGFLIFAGNTVTHRYTVVKSVLSIVFAIVGIGIMLFVLLVIFSTYQSMYSFIANLVKEVTYRM